MLIVLSVMIVACASDGGEEDNTRHDYNYATLSRTDGLAYGHFSSTVSIYSDHFNTTTSEWVDGLPNGFSYSNRTIQGDDPGPGQWSITLHWRAVDSSTGVEGEWKQSFELRFFTKLEER
jgi:hypothetical protein